MTAPIICTGCGRIVTHTGDPGWPGQLGAHDSTCPEQPTTPPVRLLAEIHRLRAQRRREATRG